MSNVNGFIIGGNLRAMSSCTLRANGTELLMTSANNVTPKVRQEYS